MAALEDAYLLHTPLEKRDQPSHLVLIPSYNTGPRLIETVRAAMRYWQPVWVVIDGSTDGSEVPLRHLADLKEIRVLVRAHNGGKGEAILHGLRAAENDGFSHVLTMDADGQHPADLIPNFMTASQRKPGAVILGTPVFDASAPQIRILGRKLSNFWTNIETLWIGGFDSLFGFRVYPVAALRQIMENQRWMRGFDFDAEAVVRLCWQGYQLNNIDAPVRYFTAEQGGISHFRYGKDNLLLVWMHCRLVMALAAKAPQLICRRFRSFRH